MNNLPIKILLVEDNEGDIHLIKYCFKKLEIHNRLHVISDGAIAKDFLLNPENHKDYFMPDLIILDLNLPKVNGSEILEIVKTTAKIKHIPVIILTTTSSEKEVFKVYNLHANSFFTKPIDFDDFMKLMETIKTYWIDEAKLPPSDTEELF